MTRISSDRTIENRIQVLRLAKDLTQQQLADAVGVTRATILALEGGDYNPSLELAFRLARFFQLRVEDVFQFKGKTHQKKEKS